MDRRRLVHIIRRVSKEEKKERKKERMKEECRRGCNHRPRATIPSLRRDEGTRRSSRAGSRICNSQNHEGKGAAT